jgi:hypothetical protein
MSWETGTNGVAVDVTSNALNTAQFAGDAGDLAAPDKVVFAVRTLDVEPSTLTTTLVVGGEQVPLPDGAFYSNIPGEYDITVAATDNSGAVLALRDQVVRICQDFRRYIVPQGYVIIDIDKPFEAEIGEDGKPTGRSRINILNTSETVQMEILHYEPEDDPAQPRADVTFAPIDWPAEAVVTEVDTNILQFSFGVAEGNIGWITEFGSHETAYEYMDFPLGKIGIQFGAGSPEIVKKLSPFGDNLVVRVWKTFIPSKVPVRMAAVDDQVLNALLVEANKGVTFSGTVRVRGAVGAPTGTLEGTVINITPQVGERFKNITMDAWQTFTPVDWGIDPNVAPTVRMAPSFSLSLAILTQILGNLSYLDVTPNYNWNCKPDPKYNWLVMQISDRFKLVMLPLCIDPSGIPVTRGQYSIVPVQFFIHDDLMPGATTACDTAVVFSFPGAETQYRFITPGRPLDATNHPSTVTYHSITDNPLEASNVYTMWIYIPDVADHPPEQFLVNGEPFVTFTTKPMPLNPDGNDPDQLFGDVNRYIALGNYAHLVDDTEPAGCSLVRAVNLNREFAVYFMSVGNAENIRHGGYQFASEAHQTMHTVYWLGNNNWMGCVDEGWMLKAQQFLNERGWDSPSFLSFLSDPSVFAMATNYGLSLGLPMGLSTAYFTGAPSFNLDRNKVSMLYLANFFSGGIMPVPLVMDWNGAARMIHLSIFQPVHPDDFAPGVYQDYGLAGVWLSRLIEDWGPLYAYDVYWLDFVTNSRRNNGLRVDGFNDKPFLLNADLMLAFDPTANPPQIVVDTNFNDQGSYADNQILPIDTGDIVPGHLEIVGATQIYVADEKYGDPARPAGLQKIDWSRQYQWDYQP